MKPSNEIITILQTTLSALDAFEGFDMTNCDTCMLSVADSVLTPEDYATLDTLGNVPSELFNPPKCFMHGDRYTKEIVRDTWNKYIETGTVIWPDLEFEDE